MANHGRGIPTTITSVHLMHIVSEPGVTPIDAREFLRVDSDATTDLPGIASGRVAQRGYLPAGHLPGVSR